MRFGADILRQADQLARFTSDPPRITRVYLSREHRAAGEYLRELMRAAGMRADFDALGNVVGRYDAEDLRAPVVMSGSHQDSVVDGGRYDGLFGILSAIACVRDLSARGRRLPYTLEIVAFGDEEGVRFGTALIGSKAMAGAFDPRWLDLTDASGVSMREALVAFGGDPEAWRTVDRCGGNVAAYVEAHIEQGPVLLDAGLPVGVVTAIAGGSRLLVAVTGHAGHAGTVPMGSRRDALAAAAEMLLEVERHCEENVGLVGTVGILRAAPGAINVIPGCVEFTVDVRSGDDERRRQAIAAFEEAFAKIAARRGVELASKTIYEVAASPCDARLQGDMARAIAAHGVDVRRLPSGAGHDCMVFPAVCPTAMLFVRCGNRGVSHHPDEIMSAEDAELATKVLLHFFEHLDLGR